MAVNYDYSYEIATGDILNSLDNRTFDESDGDEINAQIATMINVISYRIILNPMGVCNSGILPITTTGIDKKKPDTNQSVTYGSVPFYFNFSTTYSDVSTNGMTINNISAGGITIGSGPRVLTELTISTQNSYTVDSVFIKAMAGNATSNYNLSIKVGAIVVFSKTVNDSTGWKVFGGTLDESLTGQVSFVFTGSASLKINSIAFNALSV